MKAESQLVLCNLLFIDTLSMSEPGLLKRVYKNMIHSVQLFFSMVSKLKVQAAYLLLIHNDLLMICSILPAGFTEVVA